MQQRGRGTQADDRGGQAEEHQLALNDVGAEIQPAEAELDQRQTEAVQAGNTTHITVVDDSGMTVSMTQTLTSFWGGDQSEYVAGFFLNDQLNRFAALDTEQNQPAPGRKSVSWSAPVLLLDDQGRPVLGIGSPGGTSDPEYFGLHSVAVGVERSQP